MNPQNDLNNFLAQLKKRVELKTGPSGSPEKTLLDAFKYFDLSGAGTASKKSFVQVMKIRIGITSTSEEELERLYGELAESQHALNYRQFISRVFDSKVNLSLRDPPLPPEPTYLSKDKADLVLNEEMLKKTLDYIVYKLRAQKLTAFLAFSKELRTAEVQTGELSQGGLAVALKRVAVDVSSEEITRIFYHLSGDKNSIKTDRFLDLLTKNFGAERRAVVAGAFAKFDYSATGKVSLQLVKELFSPKQTFAVREGRLGPEEMGGQFSDLLDTFSQTNNTFVVDSSKFEQLFSFVSAYYREDKEFVHFLENSFRFSDLPQPVGSIRNADRGNAAKLDDLSIRTAGLDDIFGQLVEQLSAKGNRAYISFLKALKCNDFDSDGFVFEKEFEKSVHELRLTFNPRHVAKLFEKFAVLRQRLNYMELLDRLVPPFDEGRKELVRQVWESLATGGSADIDFETLVGAFNARNHPDFRNGHKPDYEIKTEFTEALKTFLNVVRGTYLKISEANLLRFFEFFGRNWTNEYLQSVLEFSFRLKGKGSVKTVGISAPYGTLPDDTTSFKKAQQKALKDERSVQHQPAPASRLYEEFSKKNEPVKQGVDALGDEQPVRKRPQEYTMNAPFYTDNGQPNIKGLQSSQNGPKVSRNRPEQTLKPWDESALRPELKADQLLESQVEAKEAAPADWDRQSQSNRTTQQSKPSHSQALESQTIRNKVVAPTLESVQDKLTQNLRYVGKIPLILQLEYELTEASDDKGLVDPDTFQAVLDRHDLLKGFSPEETRLLFQLATVEEGKLHVQNFANKVRGQMSQAREREMITIFDRISGGAAEVPSHLLKNAFLPQKFRFHIYKTMTEAREMFAGLLSLFERLNLAVKDKDTYALDDFLYLADNFSFFVSAEDEFVRLMEAAFK